MHSTRRAASCRLFGLAGGGVYHAATVTGRAVRSYRTFSPLFGNCVACHDIEGAKGAGNIGPSLTGYKAMFLDTKARDAQFVYQKIADPRIDNTNTHMTVNLTTGLFNEQEICDYTAYVVSEKKKK